MGERKVPKLIVEKKLLSIFIHFFFFPLRYLPLESFKNKKFQFFYNFFILDFEIHTSIGICSLFIIRNIPTIRKLGKFLRIYIGLLQESPVPVEA